MPVLRPCIACGDLVEPPASRCPQHKLKRTQTGIRSHPLLHTARWQRLSKRIRTLSPFCENCGATTHLSVDHIIPVSEREDLVFRIENCRVLCATCNGRRKNICTDEERAMVEARLARNRRRAHAA